MAEKIECDRCGAQAEGRIVDDAGELSPNRDTQFQKKPNVKNWAFVRSPRLEGKTWPVNAMLICPACVALHIEFLKPISHTQSKPSEKQ